MIRTREQKEKIQRRTSERMKSLSIRNQCPVCRRKAALVIKFSMSGPVEVCKYKDCPHRREISTGNNED